MEVNVILKSVLNQSFWKNITESALVIAELEIDDGFTGDHCDDISEKCDSRYETCEIFSSWCCEVFLHDSCEECWEHEGAIALYSPSIQYVGACYHSGGRR